MMPYQVRPLRREDIPRLTEINPTFTAQTVLRISRTGASPFQGWHLEEIPRQTPFHKGRAYDFDAQERAHINRRHAQAIHLQEVVEDPAKGKLVGILDVEYESWRHTAWIWNLMLDVNTRGRGLGRLLFQHTLAWSRQHGLRAILLETQSNNTPACRFYAHLGFQLVGVHDIFYTNDDRQREEVALFWAYTLTPSDATR
ncbi:MAG: GNAT family N-acetyltransferase [Anaerolineales bacterium]